MIALLLAAALAPCQPARKSGRRWTACPTTIRLSTADHVLAELEKAAASK